MATAAEWIEGARLRTLPASVAPVLMGAAVAASVGHLSWLRTLLAALVALALQVAVNFSNDYSDGVRGTDTVRVGPQRLIGSGAASPKQVLAAAICCYALACLAGLALVALSGQWWLLLVGVACVLAAWFYTGGKHPYGYMGLGEVFVFIFFGLVATAGTTYTQAGRVPVSGWLAAVAMGALACAVLVCNNQRDLPLDAKSGKITLSVRLGDRGSRWFYLILSVLSQVLLMWLIFATTLWVMPGVLIAIVLLNVADVRMMSGVTGMALVKVLKLTSFAELAAGAGVLAGVLIAMVI